MKSKKPKFWDYKEPHLYSYLLLPFSIVLICGFVNFGFDLILESRLKIIEKGKSR